MDTSNQRVGRLFLIFVGICAVTVPFVAMSAFSQKPGQMEEAAAAAQTVNFDSGSSAVFGRFDTIAKAYLEGIATGRTLDEYYSRRQYLGSPPIIPHKVAEEDSTQINCLSCHGNGGWTQELQGNTPITPHPEQTSCRQCHVRPDDAQSLFVQHDWVSTQTPRLGRAYLPGAPPPIPHDLQMRGDCIACHVGPGAVAEIRVDHPSRGNCRQCHVPDQNPGLFDRQPNS